MKNNSLLIGLLIVITFWSCSSDDDNPIQNTEIESNFILDGTNFSIPNGFIIENFGFNNNQQTVFLLDGLIINKEYYGVGCDYSTNLTNGIIFNEIVSSTNGLQSGTYNYHPNQNDFTIEDVTVLTNIVVENNCVVSSESITSDGQITKATLDVEREGNSYILDFSINTKDFGTINGTYAGNLQLTQDLSE
ncbi:hypothetical protein [Marixanthomonas spongiae]|uniref:Uncharacterized protein n=1 Tax=Marixanthomonas spongiae TaxID=2174845 RepID=A0A2U0I5B3_9FLAO|nr:hypothetical protein [Marixanthomonas spongiae]PVW16301.1 hypothetical protein DDV96_03285 [Marixanthomonas spongiae]